MDTAHQSGLRQKVADFRETADVVDLVEQHQGQHLADAGHGLEPVVGLHVIDLGGARQVALQVGEPPVLVIDQRQVGRDALGDAGRYDRIRRYCPSTSLAMHQRWFAVRTNSCPRATAGEA